MKARVNRFYWEELEGIMENMVDKVREIESIDNPTQYHNDKKRALLLLLTDLNGMKGGGVGVTDEERLEEVKKDKWWKFCNNCEQQVKGVRNYCPNCGAKMDGKKVE